MEHISNLFNKIKKGSGAKSERAYIISRICDELFSQDDFKKILGQTANMTTMEIQIIFDEAKSWKTNPQALFWKLLKEKREKIKNQINEKNLEK